MRALELMPNGRIQVDIGDVRTVTVERMLGSGGFGSVWLVRAGRSGPRYALKVLQGVDGVDAERARLEASVSIPSKHIVPVFGLSQWNPKTFLILFEYFEAEDLATLIEEKRLSPTLSKSILAQTLTAVSDAHRCNIIHRDIKPRNILVGRSGMVKLIDFGISKFQGFGKSVSGEFRGTIQYTAPEIIMRGAKLADAKTDVYSLGHVLFELAVGKTYWEHKGWSELADVATHLHRTPPPKSIIEESFPCSFASGADRIVAHATTIAPEHRIQTVAEMQKILGLEAGDSPVKPRVGLTYPLLIVETGRTAGARTVLGLSEGEARPLGREDIAGNDQSIRRGQSGGHLEFSRKGSRYFVRDLGSSTGTLVRGVALEPKGKPMEVNNNDRIKVGDIFLRFEFERVGG